MLISAQLLNNSDTPPTQLRPNSEFGLTEKIFVPLRTLKSTPTALPGSFWTACACSDG